MAAVLSSSHMASAQPFAHLTAPFDPTSAEGINDIWRHQQHYHHSMTLPVDRYWPESHQSPMGGMHDQDLRMFHTSEAAGGECTSPFTHNDSGGDRSSSLLSTHFGYNPDTNWGSEMEIGAPSTAEYPHSSDVTDGYHNLRDTSTLQHHHHHSPNPSGNSCHDNRTPQPSSQAHSPGSSDFHAEDGYISPHQPIYATTALPDVVIVKKENRRPNLTRSITASAVPVLDRSPTQHHMFRRDTVVASSAGPSSSKRSGSEDEGDDEYVLGEENQKPPHRGRKRQRIPHTAVERRYRENLNAHLDRLRQTVPSLASKRAAGASKPGDGLGEGVKPSKCEVLNGAIEHIGALGKENSALKTEVNALRLRLGDLERWCSASGGVAFAE